MLGAFGHEFDRKALQQRPRDVLARSQPRIEPVCLLCRKNAGGELRMSQALQVAKVGMIYILEALGKSEGRSLKYAFMVLLELSVR